MQTVLLVGFLCVVLVVCAAAAAVAYFGIWVPSHPSSPSGPSGSTPQAPAHTSRPPVDTRTVHTVHTARPGGIGPPGPGPTGGWMTANGTSYASYASCCPGSPNYDPHARTTECTDDSACQYIGEFDGLGHKPYDYVKKTNIVSFFSTNPAHSYKSLRNKYIWIRNRKNGVFLKAIVGDTCADTDCSKGGPCCSNNAKKGGGYLVDIEMNTLGRFSPGTDYNNFEDLIDWQLA